MAYERRITETGDIRILESGDARVLESSSGAAASGVYEDLGAFIWVKKPPGIGGKIYIVTAGEGGESLGSSLLIPTYVGTPTPNFTWENSTEADGDTVTYEIQLAVEFDWDGPTSFTETGISEDPGGTTSHRITTSLTENVIYNWRVRAWDGYEYSDWSYPGAVWYAAIVTTSRDLFAEITVIKSLQSDLGAQITVIQDGLQDLGAKIAVPTTVDLSAQITITSVQDLDAQINVLQDGTKDLGGQITVIQTGQEDLGSQIFVPAREDLGAEIRLVVYDQQDFGGSIIVSLPAEEDLGAKINLVEYAFTGMLAQIEVLPYKDLYAQIFVPGRKTLSAKIYISHSQDLGASITIPRTEDLGASIDVSQYGTKDLGAKLFINHSADLGAKLIVDAYGKLDAKITVTVDHQLLGAKINVGYKVTEDLGASITVHGDLRGSITVVIADQTDLGAQITVSLPDSLDLGASLLIPAREHLDAQITIIQTGEQDLGGLITTLEDVPDDVVVTADVTEGVWQSNDNPVFQWVDPYDEFYGIKEYYVAWNKIPDYEVSASDQLVPANTIDKTALDADKWYFHIRAVNDIDNWSVNTTHFEVWFNNAPGAVGAPLRVEGLESPTIQTTAPEFSWGNAVDPDQLDVIKYNLQISTNISFDAQYIVKDIDEIPHQGAGSRTEFNLPVENKIEEAGLYYWRVRATDAKQYGPWSSNASFILEPIWEDLGASLTIPTPALVNFKASVNVIPYENLGGRVNVYTDQYADLGATIIVSYKWDAEFGAKVFVPARVDLQAKVSISPYATLKASITITEVPGDEDLLAKISVGRKWDAELGGRLNVKYGGSGELSAQIAIFAIEDLGAEITVYDEDHFGFIDDFSQDFPARVTIIQDGAVDFPGNIYTIADRPGELSISANVEEAVWQSENNIVFEWTQATPGLNPIEGYYTQLDRVPDTEADESFQNTLGFQRLFDLELVDGAGIYYFHVAAKGVNGYFGPTDHYAVWYNTVPSVPTFPMTVNNQDSLYANPTVSVVSDLDFEWGQSIDVDPLDVITYTIEIATEQDFGLNDLDESSIIYSETGIPTFTHTISGGQVVSSGQYYWRVKATDGHQETNWGPVARFVVNTPPAPPTGLTVYRA